MGAGDNPVSSNPNEPAGTMPYFQNLHGVLPKFFTVHKAPLIDSWILQMPLLIDYTLNLLTVSMDLDEKQKQEWSTTPSLGRIAISHPTYWSMKQECERKIKLFHIQYM